MSKCWYCNEEITTAGSPKHIGICPKCYGSMFQVGNEFIKGLMDKIADLEAKLEQSQKEKELDNIFWEQECDSLQKTLAEKDKIIENLKIDLKDWQELEEKLGTKYDKVVEQLAEKEKAKTDIAIAQLEKVKEFVFEQDIEITRLNRICDFIDQQIKELKEGK